MSEPDRPVLSAAYRVRDLVNESHTGDGPLWRQPSFGSVCAAMDVIEDSQMAVHEYLGRPEGAVGYLEVYGLFQALFLQQDAVRELMSALDIEGYPAEDARLRKARELRNDITGHPSRRDQGRVLATQLSRNEMTRSRLRIARHPRDGGPVVHEGVEPLALLVDQEACLVEVLEDVAATLEERERKHRRMHRDEKICDLLPPYLGYAVQKINEAAESSPGSLDVEFALVNVKGIDDVLSRLRSALEARGLDRDESPFIWLSLDRAGEALESARQRLDGTVAAGGDRPIVLTALACLLLKEIEGLIAVAEEIDGEYASDVVD